MNVLTYPYAGCLDVISPEETKRDLRAILGYIRADKRAVELRAKHSNPSIARAVLTAIWQEPRTGFHRQETDGRKGIFYFGSKLLLVPWSLEAFERMKAQNNTEGLILEHVMPIDAIWKDLTALEATTDTGTWALEAEAYLRTNFTLAVVTTEQARAVDAAGFRKVGIAGRPFARYFQAAQKVHKNATSKDTPPNVEKFVHPGFDPVKHDKVNLRIEADSDDV